MNNSGKPKQNTYDFLVTGAGFAGSLVALIMNEIGFRVCLVEKDRHPRFAIGESSTPVADMILRTLSERYHLPWLADFSRYGSWQRTHPEVNCGIKRGFSYFKHEPGLTFHTTPDHRNELLVAASNSDEASDTNWLRADFDAFLVDQVKSAGIDYMDLTEVTRCERNSTWRFTLNRQGENLIAESAYLIDATGSAAFAQKLLGISSSAVGFQTDSFAIFSHFDQVPHWKDLLKDLGIPTGDYPYDPDYSALHQILLEGWIWMLRFKNDRLSMGMVLNQRQKNYNSMTTQAIWNQVLDRYPSVREIMKGAVFNSSPGKLIRSPRLQRKMTQCFGPGWVSLPHSIGFVDPLFSSGIAHTLSGVEKIIPILKTYWGKEDRIHTHLSAYQQSVFEELELVDLIVAGSYETFSQFDLFNAWSMCYFAATIAHETRRMQQLPPGSFLNADDPRIKGLVQGTYGELLKLVRSGPVNSRNTQEFTKMVTDRIKPFNTAGLLDPNLKNMYRHTAAVW